MTAHFVQLLDALQRRSLRMANLVEDILHEACEAAFDTDEALARRVVNRDQEVDTEEVQIEAEAVRLMALYQPVGSDLRLLCTILKVNNDLERIADCAVNIAERAQHLHANAVKAQVATVEEMGVAVRRMLRTAMQAYSTQDANRGRQVLAEDDAIDALYGETVRSIVADAARRPNNIADYLDILSVAKNLERVADHATNIAEDVIYLDTGKIVRHTEP
jgi:phosphate transport system protein